MSPQESDKAPITFRDVAAYFSEEEWQLLRDWQKELYKNVMKDIQQALISLGPLIATSVFSLRAKEKDDLFLVDNQDSERSHDVSFLKKGDGYQNVKDLQDTARRESNDCLNTVTGPGDIAAVVSFRIKEEGETNPMDHQESERRDGINCPTGFPFLNTELEASVRHHHGAQEGECSTGPRSVTGPAVDSPLASFSNEEEGVTFSMSNQDSERQEAITSPAGFPFLSTEVCLRKEESAPIYIDHLGVEVGESSTDPNSGPEVVSFCLKDEQDTYCMDHHDSETIEIINSPTRDGTVNRKHKAGDSVKYNIKETACKASSRKAKVKMFQMHEKGTPSRSHLCTEMNPELGGEETPERESGFSDQAHLHYYPGMPQVQESETYMDWGNNPCHPNLLACQQNIQRTTSLYSCTECEETFSKKEYLIGHKRTHAEVRPFQCTECDRTFSRKYILVVHKRTHTGERPYHCTICDKSFSQQGVLSRHQRTHTHVQT